MRLARWIRLGGTVVIVVLIVLLATIAYSAAKLQVQGSNGNNSSQTSFGPDKVLLTTSLNLTNAGLYPITGLSFDVVAYEQGGPIVGTTHVPPVDIGSGASYSLPIVVTVSTAPGTPGQALLTTPAELNVDGWLNATFGYLLSLSLRVTPSNLSNWSAPFEGFAVHVLSTGPTTATVSISFSNEASIDVVGTMHVVLLSSGGTLCGSAVFSNLDAHHGSSFSQSMPNVAIQSGCAVSVAQATISGSAPASYSFTLPEVNA